MTNAEINNNVWMTNVGMIKSTETEQQRPIERRKSEKLTLEFKLDRAHADASVKREFVGALTKR